MSITKRVRHKGHWLTGLGIVLVALVITASYVLQPAPRSALDDAVGVRRSRPFRSPFCGWFVRETRLGTWPSGEAVCAWYRAETTHRKADLDELSYHVLTRRVDRAARSWEPMSEAAWKRDVDSVRMALRNHGGVPTPGLWAIHKPGGVEECWRFPAFGIELSAGSGTTPAGFPGEGEKRWGISLRGGPAARPPRCIANR